MWGRLGRLAAKGALSLGEVAQRARVVADAAGSAGTFSASVQQEALVRAMLGSKNQLKAI